MCKEVSQKSVFHFVIIGYPFVTMYVLMAKPRVQANFSLDNNVVSLSNQKIDTFTPHVCPLN